MPYDSSKWSRFVKSTGKTVTVAPIRIDGNSTFYQDARSAAFCAMGMSIKERQPVTLLLPGSYLASAYTAITEAWFQKAAVIVYAFYKKVSDVNTGWADRCAKTMTVHVEEYEEKANEIAGFYYMQKPVLINIVGVDVEDAQMDYSDVMATISKIDASARFICYNSIEHPQIINIKTKHKYGVLSKYIGMSTAINAGYLLCNADCVLVDVNIFRTRYANGNMKIVMLDDGQLKENQIDHWIRSNGWLCRRIIQMEAEAAKWLKMQTAQAVLIIGDGNVYTY